MSLWATLLLMAGLLALLAVFSGAETGLYSVSRVRLEAEAEEGRRSARTLSRLLRDDAGVLIALLLGNNLVLEVLAYLTEQRVERAGNLPAYAHELVAALLLTPLVFLFGELVPKDLFRRRPHFLLALVAPFVNVFRWLAAPIVWPLTRFSAGLERLLGLRQEDFNRVLRREEMIEMLAEGRRSGVLTPHAEELAHNVLVLRHTPLSRVAMPWSRVDVVDLDRGEGAARQKVLSSDFTRLPVMGTDPDSGRVVLGYLHQLDVLGADPLVPLSACVRPLLELPPELPLDRAVSRMQSAGQRLALLGSARSPAGLVSLMDLFATITARPRFSQPGAVARIGPIP